METLLSENNFGVAIIIIATIVLAPRLVVLIISECRTFGVQLGELEEGINILNKNSTDKLDTIEEDFSDIRTQAKKLHIRANSAELRFKTLLRCLPMRLTTSDEKGDTQSAV